MSAWLVLWAIALFCLLGWLPFLFHSAISRRTSDPDRRWELAVVAWGATAAIGAVGFAALALSEGIGTEGLEGFATIGLIETGLVVVAVLALVLTTG